MTNVRLLSVVGRRRPPVHPFSLLQALKPVRYRSPPVEVHRRGCGLMTQGRAAEPSTSPRPRHGDLTLGGPVSASGLPWLTHPIGVLTSSPRRLDLEHVQLIEAGRQVALVAIRAQGRAAPRHITPSARR